MRRLAKIFAVLFGVLFVLLAVEIWALVELVGTGKGFWTNWFVLFTELCLAISLSLILWLVLTKERNSDGATR